MQQQATALKGRGQGPTTFRSEKKADGNRPEPLKPPPGRWRYDDGLADRIDVENRVTHSEFRIVRAVERAYKRGVPFFVGNAELSRSLRMPQQTVANCITSLVKAGILLRRKCGPIRYLRINSEQLLSDSGLPKSVTQQDSKDSLKEEGKRGNAVPPNPPAQPPLPDRAGQAQPQGGPTVSDRLVPKTPSARDKRPKCAVDETDRAFARQVRSFARTQNWLISKSPRRWEEAAAILRRRLTAAGRDAGELAAKWAWYAAHYDKLAAKLPTIRNVSELDARWEWLSDVYERETAAPTVELDRQKYGNLLTELSALDWRNGRKDQLASVLAESAANVSRLVKILRSRWPAAAPFVLGHFGSPERLLDGYFRALRARLVRWHGWSGSLRWFAWTPFCPESGLAAATAGNLFAEDLATLRSLWEGGHGVEDHAGRPGGERRAAGALGDADPAAGPGGGGPVLPAQPVLRSRSLPVGHPRDGLL